ncbi:MAG TPA: hypothetical protein VG276_28160 [Actinomycetes bacterium]|jgi:hypothetical protein|nr:hypothetical protein [Actinomycetes bacterium]
MTRLCFLDTETTSLDPDRGEVYEIGLIVRDPGSSALDLEWRWWLPIDLGRADPMSLEVGRYFERRPPQSRTWTGALQWAPDQAGQVEQADTWEVAASLMELTASAHLVGAVPSFDAAFLSPFLRQRGCCPAWHYHLCCVENLAVGYLAAQGKPVAPPWVSHDLSTMMGVDVERYEKHTALGDARWARDLYDAVMSAGGR